jgi:hypothetical protein
MTLVRARYVQMSVRVEGKATTLYLGSGPAWEALQAQAAARRREARQAAADRRELRRAEEARGANVKALVIACLEGLGYVRYHRNPWRRTAVKALPGPITRPVRSRVERLVSAVKAGAPGALADLRAMADEHPALVAECTHADLVAMAETALVLAALPGDGHAAMREGFHASFAAMAAELAGDGTPGPARRLAIQAAVFAWAEHWYVAAMAVTNPESTSNSGWARRQDGTHRRLMSSLKTLAQITAAERPVRRVVIEQAG